MAADACVEEIQALMKSEYPAVLVDRALVMRFAESRDFNPKKTVDILEKYFAAAAQYKMGELADDDPRIALMAANRSVVELDPGKYPDIDGNMIVFNSIAAGKAFIEKHGFADLEDELLFAAHTIFRRGQYMAASGVAKYSLLMDISGGGKAPVKIKRMRKIMELQSTLNRGMASRFVVYPASKKVVVVYSILKRFMKKRVVDRVVLIPREKKADLLKYFPKASLPPHLGGSNTSISVIPPSLSAEDEDEDEDFDEKAILAEAEDATSC